MLKAAILFLTIGGLAGCASNDFDNTSSSTSTSAAAQEKVPGSDAGPGLEPAMHGTTPGVKW